MTTATPEEARLQIVNLVRDFVKREVEPVAAKLDHEDIVPHDLIDQMKELAKCLVHIGSVKFIN